MSDREIPKSKQAHELKLKFQALHEIVHAARDKLERNTWDYLRGGTETETTLKRNRASLDAIAFRPRVLRDVRKVDTGATVMGKKMRLPICLAPIGSLESFDPEGGVAAMRAASAFGCALMLSSVSTIPLETVAKGGDGFKIAMLYKRGGDAFLDAYVERSIAAGYDAFCLTVDSANYSRRERDIANRFVKPWRTGRGADWQAARAAQRGDGTTALEQRAGVSARGPEDVELARLVDVLAVVGAQNAAGVPVPRAVVRAVAVRHPEPDEPQPQLVAAEKPRVPLDDGAREVLGEGGRVGPKLRRQQAADLDGVGRVVRDGDLAALHPPPRAPGRRL